MASSKLELIAKELQLLNSEKFNTVYFHGKTMLPFLREADELSVIPITPEEVKLGDIVTYYQDDKFPTRRVIKDLNSKNSFLIQGDNIPKIKFIVPYDLILGKVVARKRNKHWIYPTSAIWKWTTFKILKRERLKYKLKNLKKRGLAQTIKRLF
jgi:hypothetical protein